MPGAGKYDRLLSWRPHDYAAEPADGYGSAADDLAAPARVWAAVTNESAGPEPREGGDTQVRRATAAVRGCRPVQPLDTLTEVLEGVERVWEVESARPDIDARETLLDLVSPPTRPGP